MAIIVIGRWAARIVEKIVRKLMVKRRRSRDRLHRFDRGGIYILSLNVYRH
jgi:hypothetical protein